MKKEWLVKTFALGVVVLFIIMSFTPNISGDISESRNKEFVKDYKNLNSLNYDRYRKIEVIEFKADSSIVKNIVKVSQEQLNEIKDKLKETNDLELKLSIYKQYGLIPEDVTSERLKKGMMEKLQRMNYTEEELAEIADNFNTSKSLLSKNIHLNFKCQVTAEILGGFGYVGIMPFILSRLNYLYFIGLINFSVPSPDFFNSLLGYAGVWIENGLLPDWSNLANILYILTVGFVGYAIRPLGFIFYPFIGFLGYAVCVFSCVLMEINPY